MNNSFVDLQTLVGLSLDNDVDFEIWHGETTNQDRNVRAHMLLNPADAPAVKITFGDKKHGQRVSRVTLSSNDKIEVKLEDVWNVVNANRTGNSWKRVTAKHDQPVNLSSGKGLVEGYGEIIFKDETWGLVVENFYAVASETKPFQGVSSEYHLVLDEEQAEYARSNESQDLNVYGKFVYPNTIEVTSVI